MTSTLKKAALGIALGATAIAGVAPAAQAQSVYGRGSDGTTGAIIGGILGAILGGAIGSSTSNDRNRVYNRGHEGTYGRDYNQGYDPRYESNRRYEGDSRYYNREYRNDPYRGSQRGYPTYNDGYYYGDSNRVQDSRYRRGY